VNSPSAKEALRLPSLACAEQGKQKAWFFLSFNFNDFRHLTYGTSMCRGTSALLRRGFLSHGEGKAQSCDHSTSNHVESSMELPNISFLGGGNMARALIGGLLNCGWKHQQICVVDPFEPTRAGLERDFAIAAFPTSESKALAAPICVLAVKPQLMANALSASRSFLSHAPLIISVAAGTTVARLRELLGGQNRIVRCMPNTPALIGAGMTALFAQPEVEAPDRIMAERVLRAVGEVLWMPSEALMDAVTAVAGSGPAYFFRLMEAMITGAIEQGLAPEAARQLVLQTALGAAQLAKQSGDPAALRVQVTSPGGTTQAALDALTQGQFDRVVADAVAAATARGKQLAS
jgi:pyrroline-5-carboxylate reductase